MTLFLLGTLTIGYGFYRVGQGNKERRELRREKYGLEYVLFRYCRPKRNAKYLKRMELEAKHEEKLLKGTTPQDIYHSKTRWNPRIIGFTQEKN